MSFLDKFKQAKDYIEISGDYIFVEELPKEEIKSKGGIIIASDTSVRQLTSIEENRPFFVRVLDVGKGYYNEETKQDEPLDVRVGEIRLVSKMAVQWFSAWGEILESKNARVGYARASDYVARFKDEAQYRQYLDALQG